MKYFFNCGLSTGDTEADVHHVGWTLLEIKNSINYCGDKTLCAAPTLLMTPHQNSLVGE